MITLNHIFDKIYCINLPSSMDRRKNIENEFQRHKCQVDFIKAISPLDLEYRKIYRSNKVDHRANVRCYCVKKCNHMSRGLRQCEIAISLSHLKTYQKILKNHSPISLICEDDVIFHSNIVKILNYLFTIEIEELLLSDKPIIIFCGANNNPKLAINEIYKYRLLLKENGVYSNYCYILNKAAAKVLVKYFYPIERPDDSYKRYLIGKKLLTCYHITPSIIGELSSGINVKAIYSRLSKKTHQYNMHRYSDRNKKKRNTTTLNKHKSRKIRKNKKKLK